MKYVIGQELSTKVVAIGRDTVFIDLNEKSEGVVDLGEFLDESGNPTVKVGDSILVYYAGTDGDTQKFTKKISAKALAANSDAQIAIIEKAYRAGLPIEGAVTNEIKGGYEVLIGGQRAFCPYSQMGGRDKKEPHYYVGKTLLFKISQYENAEHGKKNIVISNRAIIEEDEKKKITIALSHLKSGLIVKGTIKSLHNFGAIVTIQDPTEASTLDALLPISQISYDRVEDIKNLFHEGDEIEAKIIDFKIPSTGEGEHNNRYKISLSIKELEKNPWDEIDNFKVGDKIDGTIENTAPYGLFVNIAKGITGFVHISKLDGVEKNTNISKVYKPGQPFSVTIDKIDKTKKRLELTPSTSKSEDKDAQAFMSSQKDDSLTYNPFAALLDKKDDSPASKKKSSSTKKQNPNMSKKPKAPNSPKAPLKN